MALAQNGDQLVALDRLKIVRVASDPDFLNLKDSGEL